MRCSSCQKNILLFLDGELAEKRLLQMQNHLQQCSSCRTIAQKMRMVYCKLPKKTAPVPPFLYTRLQVRLQSMKMHPRRNKLTDLIPNWQPLVVGILIVAAVFCGYFLGDIPQPVDQNQAMSTEQLLQQTFSLDVIGPNPSYSLGEAMMMAFEE